MNTNALVILSLIAGVGLGYGLGSSDGVAGTHMMDDSSMHGAMESMTSRMHGKTGDELDRIFLEDMIVHHQGAIDMAQMLAAGTKRPELQAMASDIIFAQTGEIASMRVWLKAWFGIEK
jgi:uncharacterized protein (DUF305 family)